MRRSGRTAPVPRSPRRSGGPRAFAFVLLVVIAPLFTAGSAKLGATSPAHLGSVTTTTVRAQVGALFTGSGTEHSCSASVVHSRGHDLLLTAAHCITGTGRGAVFVPGYDRGRAPYGRWTVQRAYVDPRWRSDDPQPYDVAVLQVADQRRGGRVVGIEDVVGADELGRAPSPGQEITVIGYLSGSGDRPISCTAVAVDVGGPVAFDCSGYGEGTSGGPFLEHARGGPRVVGLIGGPYQGGCVDWRTYSPTFGDAVADLLQRAARGGAGDTLPTPGGDGCAAGTV